MEDKKRKLEIKIRKSIIITGIWLAIVAVFIILVCKVDVSAIGPENTEVGLSSINEAFFELTGFNQAWYDISEILGGIAFLLAGLNSLMALGQMINRKGVFKADSDLYALGVFYVLVLIVYVLFDVAAINFRPTIIDPAEGLEPSFPSSHTMLAICVFYTSAMQVASRCKEIQLRNTILAVLGVLLILTVVSRMLSGVHWFTDIIGGILISAFLISIHYLQLLEIDKVELNDPSKIVRPRVRQK